MWFFDVYRNKSPELKKAITKLSRNDNQLNTTTVGLDTQIINQDLQNNLQLPPLVKSRLSKSKRKFKKVKIKKEEILALKFHSAENSPIPLKR